MKRRLHLYASLCAALAIVSPGCGDTPRTPGTTPDDLAIVRKDLASGPDMPAVVDMAMPDIATSDDLVMAPDMTTPPDLSMAVMDLTAVVDAKPADLAVANDASAILDLSVTGDASRPPDFATAPDLNGVVMPDLSGAQSDSSVAPDMVATGDMAGAPVPNLIVLQVGDAKAALTSSSTPGYLHRINLAGVEQMMGGWPVVLPVAVNGNNHPIAFSGTATSEGSLSLSANGKYIVLAGYDSVPGVATIASTASMMVNRVVARVDAAGVVDTTTRFNTAFDANNIRGATSVDGTAFWASGTASNAALGGVQYIAFGMVAPGVQVLATPNNTRVAHVYPIAQNTNQLFATSGSANYTTVLGVGVGTPSMAGQMANIASGFTTTGASPYSFALLDRNPNVMGADTLYMADDRAIASGGGIQKWTFDGMKWTLATTFQNGLATGARGLTAFVTGNNVTVVITTADSSANFVGVLVDDGSMNPAIKNVLTAPMNTIFRGVALAPQ